MPFPVLITLALQKVVDQLLANSPKASAKCSELQDKVIKFYIQGVDATAYILVIENGLEILTQYDYDPDVTFSGLPSGYIALSKNSEQALLDNAISVKGDFVVGQNFNHLIDLIEVNIEQQFSEIIGNDLSNHFFAKNNKQTLCDYKRNQWQDILQSKLNVLPLKAEVNIFNQDVDILTKDLQALQQTIKRLSGKVDV